MAAAVVDPKYCLPQEVTLVMQEARVGLKNDNFKITDQNGAPYFILDAAFISMSDKRTLLDAYNQPAVQIEKKLLSLHGTWLLNNPRTGQRIAEVKPALMSLTPSVKVYLNDGDDNEDYLVSGNFRAKKFSIVQKGGKEVATVAKESKFSSATAFLMSQITTAQKYFVTIQPGVDIAFIVALATLIDEIFQDNKEGAGDH